MKHLQNSKSISEDDDEATKDAKKRLSLLLSTT